MGPGNDLVGGEVRSPGRDLGSRAGCRKAQRPVKETPARCELQGFPFIHEYSCAAKSGQLGAPSSCHLSLFLLSIYGLGD